MQKKFITITMFPFQFTHVWRAWQQCVFGGYWNGFACFKFELWKVMLIKATKLTFIYLNIHLFLHNKQQYMVFIDIFADVCIDSTACIWEPVPQLDFYILKPKRKRNLKMKLFNSYKYIIFSSKIRQASSWQSKVKYLKIHKSINKYISVYRRH